MEQLADVREQIGRAADVVFDELRAKWQEFNQGPGVFDSLRAFAAAVDWTEPWIRVLLGVHIALLVLVLACRRRPAVQGAIFCLGMAVVYNAERLNSLASQHWQRFARQPYFDPHGVFTSAVLSAPLLVIMFVILVSYLLQTVQLLVVMKRKELQHKARQQGRRSAAWAEGQAAARDAKKKEPKKDK